LIDEDFFIDSNGSRPMSPRSVSHIMQHGGTILRSRRCDAFFTEEGRRTAARILHQNGIDALVLIGGDGTFRGASELAEIWNGRNDSLT
jgi:6-phosphofructokinase 1